MHYEFVQRVTKIIAILRFILFNIFHIYILFVSRCCMRSLIYKNLDTNKTVSILGAVEFDYKKLNEWGKSTKWITKRFTQKKPFIRNESSGFVLKFFVFRSWLLPFFLGSLLLWCILYYVSGGRDGK